MVVTRSRGKRAPAVESESPPPKKKGNSRAKGNVEKGKNAKERNAKEKHATGKDSVKASGDVGAALDNARELPRSGSSFNPASFPHLFDQILDGQSVQDLLALRSTCRALRDRVDAQLAQHLVLKFATKNKDRVHVAPRVFERNYRLSALPGSWGTWEHWAPFFDYTRVLDLCGGVSSLLSDADRAAFTNLHTLRVRGTPSRNADYAAFRAQTMVVMIKPSDAQVADDRSVRLPEGTRKLVLNCLTATREEVTGVMDPYVLQPPVNVVMILEPRVHPKSMATAFFPDFDPRLFMRDSTTKHVFIDRDFIEHINVIGTVRCTFVGVGQFIQLHDLAGSARVAQAKLPPPTYELHHGATDGPFPTELLSRAWYRKFVGDEVFALETDASVA